MHRNRALNGDVVVCVLLPTQPTNKCENGCVENSVSPQNQPNKQPTPNNLAVVSELKENISKMTKESDKIDKRSTTTKTKIEYDNMVISEIQNYLEKQGQKLSKE